MKYTSSVLADRVSRFDRLEVLTVQQNHDMPTEVTDIIWSRKLMPVIALEGEVETPFGKSAPIKGAAGMTMTLAVCPPGTGPSAHSHRHTFETFTVMQGRFKFSVGAESEESVTLGLFDTISVPPGEYRAFRNISREEGILQVIITGGVHDMDDIYFPARTAEEIAGQGKDYLEYFKNSGMTFCDTD